MTDTATDPNDTGATPAAGANPDTSPDTGTPPPAGGAIANPGDTDGEPIQLGDDWRKQLAGDDDKALKRLERMSSPADVWKSYTQLEGKLNDRAAVPQPPKAIDPEKATDAEKEAYDADMKAFREAAGVPETPDGYLDHMDGLVLSDADKEHADSFLKSAHEAGLSPDAVGTALNWYNTMAQEAETQQAEKDSGDQQQVVDTMREQWGGDYRANMNSMFNFLDTAPDGLKDQLLQARMADGTMFGNHPDVLNWLHSMAKEANPAGFVAPATGGDQLQSVEQEIATIEKKMGTPEYTKDEKMQQRLRDLYSAQERLTAR